MIQWWHLDVEETIKTLKSDKTSGLTFQEVALRLKKIGPNQLKGKKGPSALKIFFDQFKNFIIWILIVATLILVFLKEWVDAVAILAVIILNAILGFIQEYRAEKSLAALKKLASPVSRVIRDGQHKLIPSLELVPGDLIELESGDNVPADSRLIWLTSNFSIGEASLTGESTPVMKTILVLEEKETPLADRANMVYLGTSIVSGKAKAVVVETGMQTELGKIAEMIQAIEQEATPLQKKLEQFGKQITYLCIILVVIIFLLGLCRGGKLLEMFLIAVSLAVAAIPEGLPVVVTLTLALGVQRMVSRHILIKKLHSVETLGCTTVICSDKTGTLTKNEMTIQNIFVNGELFKITRIGYEPYGEFLLNDKPINPNDYPELEKILRIGVLCNGAQLVKDNGFFKITGDPTEGAVLTAAAKANFWKEQIEKDFPFVEEIPFDSERKKMTIIRQPKDKLIAFIKGAPEVILDDCLYFEEKGLIKELIEEEKRKILQVNNELANSAMRVLAFAYRVLDEIPKKYETKTIEKNLVFVGLMAMIDPPREEVKKAIEKCQSAGIKSVMITGDHLNTAVAIGCKLGLFKEDSLALTGETLDKLEDEEFKKQLEKISIYARVSPEHKLRIVRAWRELNKVVAMTGDGINDAPSVKEADIGIAMGITGTDVTKEVSDMVITDDNFASIVAAVEEGRGIYNNIKKVIHYLLSCNASEVLVMFVSSLLGLPIPLWPIQILWMNLVTDSLPALALGVEPVDPKIMSYPSRSVEDTMLNKQKAFSILAQGSFFTFITLLVFSFVLFVEKRPVEYARTMGFTVLIYIQLFHALNCRNMVESVFKIGIFTNKPLILTFITSFLLQTGIVYLPFSQKIFKLTSLKLIDLLFIIIISSFTIWIMELVKIINKKVQRKTNT